GDSQYQPICTAKADKKGKAEQIKLRATNPLCVSREAQALIASPPKADVAISPTMVNRK
ncbi:unnamed protein product, partial [marine sediment metagenome]